MTNVLAEMTPQEYAQEAVKALRVEASRHRTAAKFWHDATHQGFSRHSHAHHALHEAHLVSAASLEGWAIHLEAQLKAGEIKP